MAMTAAERMQRKRERDREKVWGESDGITDLSDSALLDQLRIAWAKAKQSGQSPIAKALLQEIERRLP